MLEQWMMLKIDRRFKNNNNPHHYKELCLEVLKMLLQNNDLRKQAKANDMYCFKDGDYKRALEKAMVSQIYSFPDIMISLLGNRRRIKSMQIFLLPIVYFALKENLYVGI